MIKRGYPGECFILCTAIVGKERSDGQKGVLEKTDLPVNGNGKIPVKGFFTELNQMNAS